MSNLRDAIVHMALRRPYLYLLVTLVISIVPVSYTHLTLPTIA